MNLDWNRFHPEDPLWDGMGCGPSSTCCSLNNPPWFLKRLSSPTTDDIEMRVCVGSNDETPIEMIELYIITESVDSVCRDTTYTQYMLIQKNLSKSQKRYTYKPL